MKFKKFASLALAGAMSFSLAAPAFASSQTEIKGTYAAPVIAVDVTTNAAAFINPLGLDVEIDTTNHVKVSNRQIISAPMTIKNKSAMDLQVDASMTATVNAGSDMRFVTATTGGTGATKSAFAYLQAKQAPTLTGADTAVTEQAIATAYAAWDASPYSVDTDLVVNTAMASSKQNLVVVRAAKMDVSGAFSEYNANSVALVRLAGDCVAAPTTASWNATLDENGDPAANGDGFTVNVAYTFKPASITKYAVNVSVVDAGGTGAGATVDLANAAEGDTVTITTTGTFGNAAISIKDADNNAITSTPASMTGAGTATFTMPASAVTVTVTISA